MTLAPGQLVVTPLGTGTVKWIYEASKRADMSTVMVLLGPMSNGRPRPNAIAFYLREVRVVQ